MQLSSCNKKHRNTLINKLQEGGPIPLDTEGFTNISIGMESCGFKQISGSNITVVIKQLKEVLTQISAMYRDELTSESLCYQLIAPENLLCGEYQQVKDEFNALSELHEFWMMEGVVLDNKRANDEILILIFYFQGAIDLIYSNEKTQCDLADLDIPSFLRPISGERYEK